MSPQQGLRGIPGVGFKLTDDGNYNIDGKRLTNVGEPTGDNDPTTKAYFESENSKKADKTYVDSEISKVKVHSSPNYHLQQSFTFDKAKHRQPSWHSAPYSRWRRAHSEPKSYGTAVSTTPASSPRATGSGIATRWAFVCHTTDSSTIHRTRVFKRGD